MCHKTGSEIAKAIDHNGIVACIFRFETEVKAWCLWVFIGDNSSRHMTWMHNIELGWLKKITELDTRPYNFNDMLLNSTELAQHVTESYYSFGSHTAVTSMVATGPNSIS